MLVLSNMGGVVCPGTFYMRIKNGSYTFSGGEIVWFSRRSGRDSSDKTIVPTEWM